MKFIQFVIILLACSNILTSDNFLQYLAKTTGTKINIEKCDDGKSNFKVVEIKSPTELILGETIKISVDGMMISEELVDKLVVQTLLNKQQTSVDTEIDKRADVKKGPYTWSFEYTPPSFTPPGLYETIMKLLNSKGEVLECLNSSLTVE